MIFNKKESSHIGAGRFRILGRGGGQGLEYCRGGQSLEYLGDQGLEYWGGQSFEYWGGKV